MNKSTIQNDIEIGSAIDGLERHGIPFTCSYRQGGQLHLRRIEDDGFDADRIVSIYSIEDDDGNINHGDI